MVVFLYNLMMLFHKFKGLILTRAIGFSRQPKGSEAQKRQVALPFVLVEGGPPHVNVP